MKGKVLMLCPDQDVVKIINTVMDSMGHSCVTAKHVDDYIQQVKKDQWDVVFVDIRMHKLPFARICNETHKTQPEAEIVLLSNHTIPDTVTKSDIQELCTFLILPATPEKVKGMIERLMARAELGRENKRLLLAITAAKKQWEGTVDAIDDPIIVTDFDYVILRANLATFRRLGRGINEVVGRKFHELFFHTDTMPEDSPSKRARDAGEPASATILFKGLKERLTCNVYPQVFVTGGGLVHYLQKPTSNTEQEAETMARYERLFMEAAVPILLVNTDDMQVIEANAKAIEFFGRDPESMSEMDLENLFAPASRESTISGILAQIEEQSPTALKTRVLDNLGNEMDVSLLANPIDLGGTRYAEIFVITNS